MIAATGFVHPLPTLILQFDMRCDVTFPYGGSLRVRRAIHSRQLRLELSDCGGVLGLVLGGGFLSSLSGLGVGVRPRVRRPARARRVV